MVLSLNLKPLDHLGGKNHLVATETSIWDFKVWILNGFDDFRFCSLDIPAIDAYAQPRWESSKNAVVLVVLASWVGGGSVGVGKLLPPKTSSYYELFSDVSHQEWSHSCFLMFFVPLKSSKDAKMVVKDGWFIVMIFFGVCWFYMFFSWISMRCGNMLGFMWFIAENLSRAECHGSWDFSPSTPAAFARRDERNSRILPKKVSIIDEAPKSKTAQTWRFFWDGWWF